MNQVTKKQHYIWRNYLRPWTDNNSTTGRITCLRKNKIFPTSLMNIAHENYFYNIHALSDLERQCIYKMVIEHSVSKCKSSVISYHVKAASSYTNCWPEEFFILFDWVIFTNRSRSPRFCYGTYGTSQWLANHELQL